MHRRCGFRRDSGRVKRAGIFGKGPEMTPEFAIGIGANIRKSAYFDATIRAGVRCFSVYNHMFIPAHFGQPDAEYQRLIDGVVMWDVAAQRQVEISGPDAAKLVQYLTPRNLAGTKVGQGRYVPICDHDGRVLNDPVLLKLSDDRFWLSVADSDIHLWAAAIGRERGWDARVFEPDVSPLAVQGPKAGDVITRLFGGWGGGGGGGFVWVGGPRGGARPPRRPRRQRCGFWVEGNPASPGHQVAVTQGDTVVGYLSELVYSPRLQRSIGIGLIRADLVQATDLTATLPGGPVGVIPTDLPFKIPS